VVSVVGTRPEAIKMAPVARALANRRGLDHQILLTGQHPGLSPYFEGDADGVRPLPFNPSGRTPDGLREALHALLRGAFRERPADLVLVHGDTTSAVAGARAALDCGIPIGHVEAGLRSFDLDQPFPEEGNRIAIDAMADLLFAPTESAARNLRLERAAQGRIWVTGNSGIDALFEARERTARPAGPPLGGERRLILATCHRRENQGEPVQAVCKALQRMVRELPVRVAAPLPLNPFARRGLEEALAGIEHIESIEPLGYGEMVRLMESSWLILTDSGGLQEEAPALGKPVLVLRNVTERPEALASGSLELVGTEPDRIVAAVAGLLCDGAKYARMARPALPFGDGKASERIADAIEAWWAEKRK
jgi:UDP-N-acetylglucosamine 2-epimerase (non-hydrolysing)